MINKNREIRAILWVREISRRPVDLVLYAEDAEA
jgi:hypothetical protein